MYFSRVVACTWRVCMYVRIRIRTDRTGYHVSRAPPSRHGISLISHIVQIDHMIAILRIAYCIIENNDSSRS